MTTVQPTVTDLARTVARLDAHADVDGKNSARIDGIWYTREELRRSVASALAFQLSRHYGGGYISRRTVSKRAVSIALAAVGASQFTIERHARAIADMVRNDLTDGMGAHRHGVQ